MESTPFGALPQLMAYWMAGEVLADRINSSAQSLRRLKVKIPSKSHKDAGILHTDFFPLRSLSGLFPFFWGLFSERQIRARQQPCHKERTSLSILKITERKSEVISRKNQYTWDDLAPLGTLLLYRKGMSEDGLQLGKDLEFIAPSIAVHNISAF